MYGANCYTEYCLYLHPWEEQQWEEGQETSNGYAQCLPCEAGSAAEHTKATVDGAPSSAPPNAPAAPGRRVLTQRTVGVFEYGTVVEFRENPDGTSEMEVRLTVSCDDCLAVLAHHSYWSYHQCVSPANP